MDDNRLAMELALRVLQAIVEHRQPDPADVSGLRKYDGSGNGRDLDELACDVIQKALRSAPRTTKTGA